MKRLTIKLEYILEVPDHVKKIEIDEKLGEYLFYNGRMIEPELTWTCLAEVHDDGSSTSELVSKEIHDQLWDCVKECKVREIELAPIGKKGRG